MLTKDRISGIIKTTKQERNKKRTKKFSIEILEGKGISKNMKEGGTDHRNS